jgi:hypothetical protein
MNDGFAGLQAPADLFRKLQHDRARMEVDEMDVYAAFDFFVTAEHMLDWILPDEHGRYRGKERQARRDGERLLQITSHIANGAKHFRALSSRHTSISLVDAFEGAFSAQSFDSGSFSPASFSLSGLHIELDDGKLVHAHHLADQVIAYWERELGL